MNYAWFRAGQARFDEAASDARAALDLVAQEGYLPVEVRAHNVLGSIAMRRGDHTHVDPHGITTANAFDVGVLQHT